MGGYCYTGQTYLWAEVQPRRKPQAETTCPGLDGTFWHPHQTGHFPPNLPKVVDWKLVINSAQPTQVLKSFHTGLKFDTRFPRLDWLQQYFTGTSTLGNN